MIRRKISGWLLAAMVAALMSGCQQGADASEADAIQTVQPTKRKPKRTVQVSDAERVFEQKGDAKELTGVEGSAVAEVRLPDGVSQAETKARGASSWETMRTTESAHDVLPVEMAEFLASDQRKIARPRYTAPAINGNAPDAHRLLPDEKEPPSTEKMPTEYVDSLGNVKYAFVDGVWHEFRYSSSEITLNKMDKDLALLCLNLSGIFNGYEVVRVDCSEVSDGNLGVRYKYSVLYRRASAMGQAPERVENLTARGSREDGLALAASTKGMALAQSAQEPFSLDGADDGRASGFSASSLSLNARIDWDRARRNGMGLVYLRCAYRGQAQGELILDLGLERNLSEARKADIEVGIYLHSQAVSEEEAVEEADLAVMLARKYQIDRPIVLALSYKEPKRGERADGLSAADRTACVRAFCSAVQKAGYTPIIHAEEAWLSSHLETARLKDIPLWLTQYNTNVTYTGPYEIWRHTAKGMIDGVSEAAGLGIIYEK